jgi:DNA-binding LacI/PurR family transcriptional regulator
MSVTLREIAESAHVSVSTASRALNNRPQVSASTRQNVLQAARQLGYPLSKLRGAPAGRRTVLLVNRHPDWKNPQDVGILAVSRRLVFGIQSVLEPRGIPVRVQSISVEPEPFDLYSSDAQVGGMVLLGGILKAQFLASLCAAGIPFVAAGARTFVPEVNCVTADYLQGAKEAVTHLISTGRRRIGFVNGPETTTSSGEKLEGFRLALCMHGFECNPRRVVACEEFATEQGHVQTLRLLEKAPDVDAILYAGDPMAVGGLRAIKETGRRVPDDVAIVGFYDDALARFTDPPLTTVRIDLHLVGQIAARRLAMLLDEPDGQAWCVTVPASLTLREST